MIDRIPDTKQLYFFMVPEEMFKVFEFIEHAGGVVYGGRSHSSKPCIYEQGKDFGQVFCSLRELGEDINMLKIDDGIFTIDPTTSPVIELQSSILRTSELSRGRIYFRGGYMGRVGWVSFNNSLYELFKSIITFMTKAFLTNERRYDAYLSRGTKSYISSGGFLAQF